MLSQGLKKKGQKETEGQLMSQGLAGGSKIPIPGGGINLSREGLCFYWNENERDKRMGSNTDD